MLMNNSDFERLLKSAEDTSARRRILGAVPKKGDGQNPLAIENGRRTHDGEAAQAIVCAFVEESRSGKRLHRGWTRYRCLERTGSE